ncbi:MAG: protein kinase, partial [Gemmatimonadales bacterium]
VDALAFAHSRGVVHRDIKPDNVMLSGRHAMVTDFGVAKAVSEATGRQALTTAGIALGTPAYMAPEQASADPHVDHRADIYAVGAMAYELLTGRTPFTSATPQAMLAAHVTEQVEPVSKHRNHVSAELEAVVMRCLEKKPADRWQSAEELLPQLEVLATPSGGMTPTDTRPLIATLQPKPSRALVAGGAGVLAVAAAAVFFLWPRGWSVEGDPRQSIVVFPFENRSGDAENDWLQEASMNLLGLSLAHWEDLRVFDDERTASLMRRRDVATPADLDFDAAQRMAMEANVGTLVIGDVRREGDSLAFEAKVHDVASGDRLATEIVRSGLDADQRFVFDSLAARILQVSGAPAGERPGIVAQTTRSLDAYREYLIGTELIQGFAIDSAEAHLLRAVELDSTFALAYIQLRNAEGWKPGGGDQARRRALIGQAQAHGQQLPVRLRTLVEFHASWENGQYLRARDLAEQMILRDSGDVEAWYQLGEAHFHHRSGAFPHPDTLGNIGNALHAFKTALELDSSYTLAYQHILDALEGCAARRVQYACVGDSAIYGTREDLEAQLGPGVLERLRDEAEAERATTAYGWVSAVPTSARVREQLIQILLAQERFVEARNQTVLLRETGDEALALALEGQALFGQRRFREAAARVSEGIAMASEGDLDPTQNTSFNPIILVAGGRISEARVLFTDFLETLPDPLPLGPRTSVPRRLLTEHAMPAFFVVFSGDSAITVNATNGFVDAVWNEFGRDTASVQAVVGALGEGSSMGVSAYLMSRDTTLLATWLRDFGEDAPPVAHAHLQLARGDTVGARDLLATTDAEQPLSTQATPGAFPEVMSIYARGFLQAWMGDLADAIETYALLDSASSAAILQDPVPLIRSWAERGALYQQLGDTDSAIEMYEKFIDAWSEGDEAALQMVDRARDA